MRTNQIKNKQLVFGGNWKAAMTPSKCREYMDHFARGLNAQRGKARKEIEKSGTRIIISPPSICLSQVRGMLEDREIANVVELAVQDPWIKAGAYTGATTFEMASDRLIDTRYSIIGHSETRDLRTNDDDLISEAVKRSLDFGINPILCVGESMAEREIGLHENVVATQVLKGVDKIFSEQMDSVIIAYEPVWAIGTGQVATPKHAQGMHKFIKRVLSRKLGPKEHQVPVIYGGSMDPKNVAGLVKQEDIHGGLIGGASLDPNNFLELIMNGIRAAK